MTRKNFIFLLASILMILPLRVGTAGEMTNRLVLFQGRILLAYYESQYIEIKRLEPDTGLFYGYGWLDSDKVFIAYDLGEQGEAIAEMEVVDLARSRTIKLDRIGGVGESHFDVNTSRGQVIYSTENAISLISLNVDVNEYEILDFMKGVSCWAAFWVDDRTVGCKVYDESVDRMVFKMYPTPTLEEIRNIEGVTRTELKWSIKQRINNID